MLEGYHVLFEHYLVSWLICICFQHPNIGGVELITCNESGGYAVRRLNPEGSLRDAICHCKPRLAFLKKYSNPKLRNALPLPQVAFIATQILHGLKFLHEKGIPYGRCNVYLCVFQTFGTFTRQLVTSQRSQRRLGQIHCIWKKRQFNTFLVLLWKIRCTKFKLVCQHIKICFFPSQFVHSWSKCNGVEEAE